MVQQLYTYAAPFIAAFVASWLTYTFAIKQKKYEVLLKEKLIAIKAVQERLTSLKRYCEASIAEVEGGDFNPNLESLLPTDPKSALMHSTALQYTVDANYLFLTPKEKQSLEEVAIALGMLCSMELTMSADPSFKDSTPSGYRGALREIQNCLNLLYEELRLPI